MQLLVLLRIESEPFPTGLQAFRLPSFKTASYYLKDLADGLRYRGRSMEKARRRVKRLGGGRRGRQGRS